jgi:RimJ/RimL family protein N-acetyltransferase
MNRLEQAALHLMEKAGVSDMKLTFCKLTSPDPEFFAALARWYGDPDIKYAIRPNFQAAEMPDPTADQLVAEFGRNTGKSIYVILDGSRMIGEVTLDTGFPMLCGKTGHTAWISILVGEKDYWRRGVGSQAMAFLESTCRDMGLNRIELGVFEFNQAAQRLYQKSGFAEIGRIEHFTYRSDRWYADIRMEKWLERDAARQAVE